MSKSTTFLGTVAIGDSLESASANFTRSLMSRSATVELMGFQGKEKDYSLLVAADGAENLINPYSGRDNLGSLETDGEMIASSLNLPTQADLDGNQVQAHVMVCGTCESVQVADNVHLNKACMICSGEMEEPEDEPDDVQVDLNMDGEDEADTEGEEGDSEMGCEKGDSEMEDESQEGDDASEDAPEEGEPEAAEGEGDMEDASEPKAEEGEGSCEDKSSSMEDESKEESQEGDDASEDEEAAPEAEAEPEAEAPEADAEENSDEDASDDEEDKDEEPEEAEAESDMEDSDAPSSDVTIQTNSDEELALAKSIVMKYGESISSFNVEGKTITVSSDAETAEAIKADLVKEPAPAKAPEAAVETETPEAATANAAPVESGEKVETEGDSDMKEESPADESVEVDGGSDMQDEAKPEVPAEDVSTVEVDLLKTVGPEETVASAELNLFYAGSDVVNGSKWWATMNSTPIAFATSESAGQNSGIFHDVTKFKVSVSKVVAQYGIRKGLEAMGFKGTQVQMPIGKVLETQIAEASAAGKAEGEALLAKYQEGVQGALSIASVGINKGFFADQTNPVKIALYKTLSGFGVQNAEEIIDTAFAEAGDSYHKTLMKKAADLMNMSSEAANEIGAAVTNASYQRAKPQSVSSLMADHLANANVPAAAPVSKPETQTVTAGGEDAQVNALRNAVKSISRRN